MYTATALPRWGLFPIGGTLNGVDQMSAFRDKDNELKHGAVVAISESREAAVTTFGKFYDGAKVAVVKVEGKTGWYLASAFARR